MTNVSQRHAKLTHAHTHKAKLTDFVFLICLIAFLKELFVQLFIA